VRHERRGPGPGGGRPDQVRVRAGDGGRTLLAGVTNRGGPAFCRRGILGPSRDIPVGSPLPGLLRPSCSAPERQMMRGGGQVTSGRFPRHARRPGVARSAGHRAGPAPARVLADGDPSASPPAWRFDPLIHPVAITGHCVIGDQIRVPAAWCAMTGCQAAFADPAALGEADNRARAVAAGWATDALGRLACPACQRDHPAPAWWVPARRPGTADDRRPAGRTARPAGATNQPGPPAAWEPPAAVPGRHHRAPRPRLLSALVGSRDGRTARAGAPIPAPGTAHGQARTPPLHYGQAVDAAGSAGRRAE
jgi:hypothetical protein